MQNSPDHIPQLLDEIYRKESRRVFAALTRLLGDFGLALAQQAPERRFTERKLRELET